MYETLLERFRTQPDALELFGGISQAALTRRPLLDKWSAHENLAHLGHYHETFAARLEQMLLEDAPELNRYRADDDPGFAAWVAPPSAEVVERMKGLRAGLVSRLEQLSPEQFDRVGLHPLYGRRTVSEWLELFLLHEAHHLYVALLRAKS